MSGTGDWGRIDPVGNGRGERFDLQVHTDASPCSGASPAAVVEAADEAGLDGVAITNHDTLAGVDEARAAAPDGLTVVSGVEVTTTAGHVLALDVRSVPETGDPLAVVEEIHDLGGVAVLSHPFDRLREHFDGDHVTSIVDGDQSAPADDDHGASPDDGHRASADGDHRMSADGDRSASDDGGLAALADAVDAVEVVNSRCLRRSYVDRARTFAAKHGLPRTGGSDAHFPMEVGRAYTVCGSDPVDAIRRGETRSGGRARYLTGHAATKLQQVSDRLRS